MHTKRVIKKKNERKIFYFIVNTNRLQVNSPSEDINVVKNNVNVVY